jgi:hypothetical protein
MDDGDDFLWYQRRAILLLCVSIFGYGLVEEPKLLWMTPLLAFVGLFAVSRILSERQ